jgi:hypothetical protein
MGWRGAGGGSAASVGVYYFFGGLVMILGGVGEVSRQFVITFVYSSLNTEYSFIVDYGKHFSICRVLQLW